MNDELIKEAISLDADFETFLQKNVSVEDLKTKHFKTMMSIFVRIYPQEYRYRNLPWVSINATKKTIMALLIEEEVEFTWNEMYIAVSKYVESFGGDFTYLKRLQNYVYEIKRESVNDSLMISDIEARRINPDFDKKSKKTRLTKACEWR